MIKGIYYDSRDLLLFQAFIMFQVIYYRIQSIYSDSRYLL